MIIKHYINQQWLEGDTKTISSIDPSTNKSLGEMKTASAKMIDSAVIAAQQAFYHWAALSFEQRLDYLKNFVDLVKAKKAKLASHIAAETGKVLWDAETEINAVIAKLNLSITAYTDRMKTMVSETQNGMTMTSHKPHGVLAVFGPYNFPAHLPNGHILPALIAGNTVIFKPSELAPIVGQKIVELWDEARIPKGVINLIQGDAETGKLLAAHDDLNGVLFTGSVKAGLSIRRQLLDTPNKILALEMGGNNPIIVHECQNLKAAAHITILSAYISSGQRCTCARRLILPDSDQVDTYLEILQNMIKKIKIGLALDQNQPFIGPLISDAVANNIMNAQEELRKKGANILIPMERQGCQALLSPGLIDVTGIDTGDQEYFGPMLQLIRVQDFDSALKEANNTAYGLAAALLSDNEELYKKFFSVIKAGVVNWNKQTTGASGALPFGGVGLSGNHRPSGFFAADYCSYPIASLNTSNLQETTSLPPGLGDIL